MTDPTRIDLSAFSLLDLFRSEAMTQTQVLADGLLALERDAGDLERIDALMRAAHSIKGAAAIVDLPQVVALSHQMEEAFVAAQQHLIRLDRHAIDVLLAGVDLLAKIAGLTDDAAPAWFATQETAILKKTDAIAVMISSAPAPEPHAMAARTDIPDDRWSEATRERAEHSLKVSVTHLDRLLALTSQSVVSAHLLTPLLQSMQRFKKKQSALFTLLDDLQQTVASGAAQDVLRQKTLAIAHAAAPLKQDLILRLDDLETHQRTYQATAQITLDEVLALRMRPLKDGVQALTRMVRDLAHSLGKEVRFEIAGENTPVDRDILARIESPLNHLLRNAIDHGIESPAEREVAGKPREAVLRLAAQHAGGMLHIEISDDGRGVDPEQIRRKVIARKMATEPMAALLSKTELLDFLFLPAFSLKDTASLVSGRGVGLDVVHETVRQQYGTVQLDSTLGHGMKITMVLPLTQSVVRSLVTEVGGQAYAIPIAKISRVLRVEPAEVHTLEDKPFITLDGEHIGLIEAAQVLGLSPAGRDPASLPVVLIGSGNRRYGLVVDQLVGEQSLAAQPLDATFGKMRDIAAGALLENGLPVLILDVADLLLSIEKRLGEGSLQSLHGGVQPLQRETRRILVVDDSLTVREMERNLLLARGYRVDVAVDGIDGWNAVRSKDYDLLITDVDMPRMDGIELVGLVKKDARLRALPVMIVSYKDRPEDRARGIDAGADYYLTKGSFHDETLLDAVIDLIGAAPP
jgi:two-component system sensor histidine kinase and response regulator WspE